MIASTEKLKEADYTPESWKAFRLALDLANAVNVNADATQEEVDAAKAELEKAVQGLVKVSTGSEQKPAQKPAEKPSKNNGTNTGARTHMNFFTTAALASVAGVLGLFEIKRRNMNK